jgi:hypothetical protein
MKLQEIASQQILLMAHVEDICEKQSLVPPVEVDVVDASGNQYNFEYRPENDRVDMPAEPILPPVLLSFTDAEGIRVEQRLSDFAPSPEWTKPFLQ